MCDTRTKPTYMIHTGPKCAIHTRQGQHTRPTYYVHEKNKALSDLREDTNRYSVISERTHTFHIPYTSSHQRWHTLFLSVIKKIISPYTCLMCLHTWYLMWLHTGENLDFLGLESAPPRKCCQKNIWLHACHHMLRQLYTCMYTYIYVCVLHFN